MFHIVDDSDVMRRYYQVILEEFGHAAEIFSCPLAYLEYIRSPEYVRPTAIITDIQMPLMDGYSMIRQVAERHPDIRFAAITGYDGVKPDAHDSLCVYLRKPVSIGSLKTLLQAFVACGNKGPDCARARCKEVDQRYISGWTCPRTPC